MEPASRWYANRTGLEVLRAATLALAPLPTESLAAYVVAAHRPIWFPNVQHDPRFLRAEAAIRADLRSGLAVPALAGDEPVAVLEFFEQQARPEDSHLQTVAAIAAQLGALTRRKARALAWRSARRSWSATAGVSG